MCVVFAMHLSLQQHGVHHTGRQAAVIVVLGGVGGGGDGDASLSILKLSGR